MFAKKLREYRLTHNLTIRKMAEFLGVPLNTYDKWEYNVSVPDSFKQNAILEKLKKENNSHLN